MTRGALDAAQRRASALPKVRDLRARYHDGSVPIEAVGLKLFTGIQDFEIMAIPFSSPPAIFLRWGRATSMIGSCFR